MSSFEASEREFLIGKLKKDKKLAEVHRYAAVIEKRKNDPTVTLDDYLATRSRKCHSLSHLRTWYIERLLVAA